jgi:hypothetical protein
MGTSGVREMTPVGPTDKAWMALERPGEVRRVGFVPRELRIPADKFNIPVT